MSQFFKLDNGFGEIQTSLINRSFFKVYKELESEIEKYKANLMQSLLSPEKKYRPFFEIPITIGGSGDYYNLVWNIGDILKFTHEKKIQAQDIPTNSISVHSCPSRLDLTYLNKLKSLPKSNTPIIIAYHLPINSYLVIDGNHRYHAAKSRTEEFIEAIVLSPRTHINFMAGDTYKECYKIHHNLTVLQKLSYAPLKGKYTISKDLGTFDYYPLTDAKVNFSLAKNINLKIRQSIK